MDQAERMLSTKYNVYYHPTSGEKVVRTLAYSLPRELHSHIDLVAPTTYFSTMKSMRVTSFLQPEIKANDGFATNSTLGTEATVPSSCASIITPACLRALYNTIDYVPSQTSRNGLGVAGYLDGSFSKVILT